MYYMIMRKIIRNGKFSSADISHPNFKPSVLDLIEKEANFLDALKSESIINA